VIGKGLNLLLFFMIINNYDIIKKNDGLSFQKPNYQLQRLFSKKNTYKHY